MAGFSSTIRFDPDHAPSQKPLGQSPPPSIGGTPGAPGGGGGAIKHVASMVGGAAGHLGAFASPGVLKQGHMKIS